MAILIVLENVAVAAALLALVAGSRRRLRGAGFTHLLVNWSELRRLEPDYPAAPWRSEAGKRRFAELIGALRPAVVSAAGIEIFALPGGKGPPAAGPTR